MALCVNELIAYTFLARGLSTAGDRVDDSVGGCAG